jgi:hypothetical protein
MGINPGFNGGERGYRDFGNSIVGPLMLFSVRAVTASLEL